MLIAVEGCAHGELQQIYQAVLGLERQRNVKVDLLICCGDFQAVRNEADLLCMAVPPKYRQMCSFYKYYSGEVVAPMLTIFIGGNHEASNLLQELAYGGWVAPNIYYLGYAGVVSVGGVRIVGISGIYNGHNYAKGHFERPPYSPDTMRSAYHVRNLEVFRLKQLKNDVDVFISHDWPRGIYNYGDTTELLRWKPFFRDEIARNSLGSQANESLLHELKPKHWFSAHLHVRFEALVKHNENQTTKFLALDKCLPRRKYLELVDIPHDVDKPLELSYDPHWLAILKSTNHLLSVSPTTQYMPGPGYNGRWDFTPSEQELKDVTSMLDGDLKIPLNFFKDVRAYNPGSHEYGSQQATAQLNAQTTELCRKLGIDDPMQKLIGPSIISISNPDEIDVGDDEEEDSERNVPEQSNDTAAFYIDTKPERSKLSLPKPKNECEDASHSEAKIELLLPERTEIIDVPKQENEQPVVKRMKRRNQDVYINPEDY